MQVAGNEFGVTAFQMDIKASENLQIQDEVGTSFASRVSVRNGHQNHLLLIFWPLGPQFVLIADKSKSILGTGGGHHNSSHAEGLTTS